MLVRERMFQDLEGWLCGGDNDNVDQAPAFAHVIPVSFRDLSWHMRYTRNHKVCNV